jgi:hypothetical protein
MDTYTVDILCVREQGYEITRLFLEATRSP